MKQTEGFWLVCIKPNKRIIFLIILTVFCCIQLLKNSTPTHTHSLLSFSACYAVSVSHANCETQDVKIRDSACTVPNMWPLFWLLKSCGNVCLFNSKGTETHFTHKHFNSAIIYCVKKVRARWGLISLFWVA